jgi:hypothetical protein
MNTNYLSLCDFNYDTYREHEDLKSLSNEQLAAHFLTFGIDEGRIFNAIKNRNDFVSLIDKKGKMLEIGPLDNPQLDHRSTNYYSVDVFSKEQLIQNYIHDPKVVKENIIAPSYVIVNNDYSEIQHEFNCIFSSHNIEHMPCVVTFLNNLDSILNKDGAIYLIIPDKRYCFDFFKRESDIYDILQLHYEKNSRPRFLDVIRMVSQSTHNNPVAHWNHDHGTIQFEEALLNSYAAITNQYNSGMYIDSHVNLFTPQSFMQIIELLSKLKLIRLKINKLYHTLYGSNEFYVILKREDGV